MLSKKTLFGALALCMALATGLNSCGTSSQPPMNKSDKDKDACNRFAFIKDMSLTGSYLKNLITCASNRTSDGESLKGVYQLVQTLDEEGLDTLIAFLLQKAPFEYEGQYPYLSLMSVLLDRGNTDREDLPAFGSLTERYDDLQNFLAALDPYRSALLVLKWQSEVLDPSGRTRLDLMLDHLTALIDQLESDSINGLSYTFLTDRNLQEQVLTASLAVLDHKELYTELSNLLTFEESFPIALPEERACLQAFDTPLPKRAMLDQKPCSSPSMALPETGLDRYQKILNRLEPVALNQTIDELLRIYDETPQAKRLRTVDDLMRGLSQLHLDQEAGLGSLFYFLQFLRDTPLSELGFLFDEKGFIGQLLLTEEDGSNNVITLLVLGNKAGSVYLNDALEEWLMAGGPLASCPHFDFQGLEPLISEQDEFRPVLDQLKLVLSPHPDCQGQIPLMAKFREFAGCTTETCFAHLKEPTPIAAFAPGQMAEIAESDLKTLVSYSFEQAQQKLTADSFALWYAGLSTGSLSAQSLEVLYQDLTAYLDEQGWQLRHLARFDLDIHEKPHPLGELLRHDFLQNLLEQEIKKTYELAYDWQDLFVTSNLDDDTLHAVSRHSQRKIQSLLQGLYQRGPTQNILKELKDAKAWPNLQGLGQSHPHSSGLLLDQPLWQSPVLLDGVATFAARGEQKLIDQAGYRRAAADNPSIQVRSGEIQVNYARTKVFRPEDLLDLTEHPLARESAYNYKGTPRWTDNFQVPLGEEKYDSFLRGCLGQAGCPLTLKERQQRIATPRAPARDKFRLLQAGQALTAKEYRLLLFYLTRHYGTPIFQLPSGLVATGASSTFPSSNKYYPYFSGYDYLSREGWVQFYLHPPQSLLRGDDLTQMVRLEDFAPFRERFYQNLLDQQGGLLANITPGEMTGAFFATMPEPQRVLAAFDLLTSVGKRSATTLAPIMGLPEVGGSCRLPGQAEPFPCLLALGSNDSGLMQPESLDQETATLVAHLNHLMTAQLCPYLQGEQGLWLQTITGWRDPKEACDTQEVQRITEDNLRDLDAPGIKTIPTWLLQEVFSDLASMGINPKPLPGLGQLSMALSFYKEKQRTYKKPASILQRSLVFTPQSAAWQTAFEDDALDILPLKLGLVDGFLGTYAALRPDGSWDNSLASWGQAYGRLIDTSTDQFPKTNLISYLNQNLKNANRKYPDMSLLAFLLEQLAYLNQPEVKEGTLPTILANLIARPYDLRSMGLYSTLNAAIEPGFLSYFASSPPASYRQDKSLELLKWVMRRENMMAAAQLLERFQGADLRSALHWSHRVLVQLAPTPRAQAEKIAALLEGLQRGFLSQKSPLSRELRLGQWQDALTQLALHKPKDGLIGSLDYLLTTLQKPMTGFRGQQTPALMAVDGQNRPTLIQYALENLFQIAADYQATHLDEDSEEAFFRQMLKGLLKPFEAGESSPAVAGLLKDPIFGLSYQTSERPFILYPLLNENRPLLSQVLTTTAKVDEDLWLRALNDSRQLMPEMSGVLELTQKKILFTDPKESVDFRRSLNAMVKLADDKESAFMLQKQIDLMNTWFKKGQYKWPSEGE